MLFTNANYKSDNNIITRHWILNTAIWTKPTPWTKLFSYTKTTLPLWSHLPPKRKLILPYQLQFQLFLTKTATTLSKLCQKCLSLSFCLLDTSTFPISYQTCLFSHVACAWRGVSAITKENLQFEFVIGWIGRSSQVDRNEKILARAAAWLQGNVLAVLPWRLFRSGSAIWKQAGISQLVVNMINF